MKANNKDCQIRIVSKISIFQNFQSFEKKIKDKNIFLQMSAVYDKRSKQFV